MRIGQHRHISNVLMAAPDTFPMHIEQIYSINFKIATWRKSVRLSAIFKDGLKCCLCGLDYYITFTKELSSWEKVKIK
jgi:hypothetical protein